MDSAYWDNVPDDAEDAGMSERGGADAEDSCSPDLEIPCKECKHEESWLDERCREGRGHAQHQQQQRRQQHSSRSYLQTADPLSWATASALADHTPADPELAVPEVVLRHPLSGDDDNNHHHHHHDEEEEEGPETAQKSALGVPGPVFAATYTSSPSWMSTYTSSTCATTYTTTHERSRRDGDTDGDDWLDVRSRRPPNPRRRSRTWRREAGARSFGAGRGWQSTGWDLGTGSGIEVAGWDAAEIEGGSYCVLKGAKWEEQRVLGTPRQQHQQQQQQQKSRSKGAGWKERRRWRGKLGRLSDVSRTRSLPLAEPPTPRHAYDVFVASTSGTGAEDLGLPYVSGRGRARAVYPMAYLRGTGSARGPWGMFAPKDEGVGGLLGVIWREGVWKGVMECLRGVLGLGGVGGWMDDVD
ncbi:hypothetical protein LZ32DRAFT_655004 [Colletotrichum eremochloae]|nr:hypothetical protein LZ32DRAFT_655004 [Colletotrichum eremochloae]